MTWEVIQGDCLEVMRGLPPASVDACITDPPYGVEMGIDKDMRGAGHGLAKPAYHNARDTYAELKESVIPRVAYALSQVSRAAVFTGPHLQDYPKTTILGGVYCSAGAGLHRWGFNVFHPILFYGTAPDLNKGGSAIVLSSNARAENNGHPCPKPLEWMRWLVRLATREGETVLDPFCGSGTTGVACVIEGRNFIGIERDAHYCEVARAQMMRASGIAADIPRRAKEYAPTPLFEQSDAGFVVEDGRLYKRTKFEAVA